jgi:P-type Na+/K+ transporter
VGEVVLLVLGLAFQDNDGYSVFPLSPLQILWINMITSGPPAFGLGLEKAVYNIMSRPPHDTKRGVFSWQIITDMIVYGLLMGVLCLCTFVIIVFGVGNGNLGHECNRTYSPDCDLVFRARAAVFAELTWLILISAWEIKSIRRSMFRLDPHSTSRFPLFKDLYNNKFLFYAVAIGAVIVFPCVYIPGFNDKVFKQKPITWEWALSIGAVVVFVAGMELWKFTKRSMGWFAKDEEDPNPKKGGLLDLKQGFFSFARTLSRTTSFGKATTRESNASSPA